MNLSKIVMLIDKTNVKIALYIYRVFYSIFFKHINILGFDKNIYSSFCSCQQIKGKLQLGEFFFSA